MAELFGAPIGIRAYNEDLRQAVAAATSAQHTLGQIAMQPAEQRIKEAQAAAAEEALRQEKLMAELMRKSQGGGLTPGEIEAGTVGVEGLAMEQRALGTAAGGKPPSMADQLDNLARAAAGAGLVTKAQTTAKAAAELRDREASALSAQTAAALNQVKIVREQANLTGQLLGGVTDQASWDRANALYTFQTGQPSPFANTSYHPERVRSLEQAAITAKERADIEHTRLTREATERFRDARLDQHNTANYIREQQLKLNRETERRRAKQGGGRQISSPRIEDVDRAAAMLRRDYGKEAFSSEDLEDTANAVASRAKELQNMNRALGIDAALQQAYTEVAPDIEQTPGVKFLYGPKARYKGRGKTPETARPLPVKPSAENLEKDRYYVNSQGVVGRWTGKKMELVPGGRPLSPRNRRPLPSDFEQEESEER